MKKSFFQKIVNVSISTILIVGLALESCVPPASAQILTGEISSSSIGFNLQGIKLNVQRPFQLSFLIDGDQEARPPSKEQLQLLVRYFLAALTIPDRDLWVNLSPAEPDRIIPDEFARTDMGKDFLQQDLELKKLTASLMDPDGETGKKFWERVYEKTYEVSGKWNVASGERADTSNPHASDNLPPTDLLQSLNKVWIVPESASVYQENDVALITESRLKVLMEKDYVATKSYNKDGTSSINKSSSDVEQIIRTMILPMIEKEVNTGERFAPLRRMLNAMILAVWFKTRIKDAVLSSYVDRGRINGIRTDDPQAKERIYQQYLQAFQAGAEGVLREEYDPVKQETVARQYVSGGVIFDRLPQVFRVSSDAAMLNHFRQRHLEAINVSLVALESGESLKRALISVINGDGLKFSPDASLEQVVNQLRSDERCRSYFVQERVGRPDVFSLDIVSLSSTFARKVLREWQKIESTTKEWPQKEMLLKDKGTEFIFRLEESINQQNYRRHLNDFFRETVNISDVSLHKGFQDNVPRNVVAALIRQLDQFEKIMTEDMFDGISSEDMLAVQKEFRRLLENIRDDLRKLIERRKSTLIKWIKAFEEFLKNGGKDFYLFDLHGHAEPLLKCLDEVRQRYLTGNKKSTVIFHGDAFDRGSGTEVMFKAFQELDSILKDDFVFLFGNHDVLMIEALLTEDDPQIRLKNMIRWIRHGGSTVLQELGLSKESIDEIERRSAAYESASTENKESYLKDLLGLLEEWDQTKPMKRAKEIALWMLKKGRFYELNAHTGWMHTHAGLALKGEQPIIDYETLSAEQEFFLNAQREISLDDPQNISIDHKRQFTKIFDDLRKIYWVYSWTEQISTPYKGANPRADELRRYVIKIAERVLSRLSQERRQRMVDLVTQFFIRKENVRVYALELDTEKYNRVRDRFAGMIGSMSGHNHYEFPLLLGRVIGSDVNERFHLTLDVHGLQAQNTLMVRQGALSRVWGWLRLFYAGLEFASFCGVVACTFPLLLSPWYSRFVGQRNESIKRLFKNYWAGMFGRTGVVMSYVTLRDYYFEDLKEWEHLTRQLNGRVESLSVDIDEDDISSQKPIKGIPHVYDLYSLHMSHVKKFRLSDPLANVYEFNPNAVSKEGFVILENPDHTWRIVPGNVMAQYSSYREVGRVVRRNGQVWITTFDTDIHINHLYRDFKFYKRDIEAALQGFFYFGGFRSFSSWSHRVLTPLSNKMNSRRLERLVEGVKGFENMSPSQKMDILRGFYLRFPLLSASESFRQWLGWLEGLSHFPQYPFFQPDQTLFLTAGDQQSFSLLPNYQLLIMAGDVTYQLRIKRSGHVELQNTKDNFSLEQAGPQGSFSLLEGALEVEFHYADITVSYQYSSGRQDLPQTVEITTKSVSGVEASRVRVVAKKKATQSVIEYLGAVQEQPVSFVIGPGFEKEDSLHVLRMFASMVIKEIVQVTDMSEDSDLMNALGHLEDLSYMQVVELIERLGREFNSVLSEEFVQSSLELVTGDARNYFPVAKLIAHGLVKELIDVTPGRQVLRALKASGATRVDVDQDGRVVGEDGKIFLDWSGNRQHIPLHLISAGRYLDRPVFVWNAHDHVIDSDQLALLRQRGIAIVHQLSPLAGEFLEDHLEIVKHLVATSRMCWLGVDLQNAHLMEILTDALRDQLSTDSSQRTPIRVLFNVEETGEYFRMLETMGRLGLKQEDEIILSTHPSPVQLLSDAEDDVISDLPNEHLYLKDKNSPRWQERLRSLGEASGAIMRYVVLRILIETDPSRTRESKVSGRTEEESFILWEKRLERLRNEFKILDWQYFDLMARLKRNQMDFQGAMEQYERLIEKLSGLITNYFLVNNDVVLSNTQKILEFIDYWRLNRRLLNACEEIGYLMKMDPQLQRTEWLESKVLNVERNNVNFSNIFDQDRTRFSAHQVKVILKLRKRSGAGIEFIHAFLLGNQRSLDSMEDVIKGKDKDSRIRRLNYLITRAAVFIEKRQLVPAKESIDKAEEIVSHDGLLPNYRVVRYLQFLKAMYFYYKGRGGDPKAYEEILGMVRRDDYELLRQLKRSYQKEWWLAMSELFVQAIWWEAGYDVAADDVREEYSWITREAMEWFDHAGENGSTIARSYLRPTFYLLSSNLNERYLHQQLLPYDENLLSRFERLGGLMTQHASTNERGSRLRNKMVIGAYIHHLKAISGDHRIEDYREAVRLYHDSMRIGLHENKWKSSRHYEIRPLVHMLQLHVDMLLELRRRGENFDQGDWSSFYREVLTNAVLALREVQEAKKRVGLHPILVRTTERFEDIIYKLMSDFVWFRDKERVWNVSRQEISRLMDGPMGVVPEIRKILADSHVMVMEGAPGSGKIIQIKAAALGRPLVRFDVRREFFVYYCASRSLADSVMNWEHFKETYQSDISIRLLEQKWLKSFGKKLLSRRIAESPHGAIIVMEQFDLPIGPVLDGEELETVKEMVEFSIRQSEGHGRDVVFMVHHDSLKFEGNQTEFAIFMDNLLRRRIGLGLGDVCARAGYFAQEAEKNILDFLRMPELKARSFMQKVNGLPVAYTGIFRLLSDWVDGRQQGHNIYDVSFDRLVNRSRQKTKFDYFKMLRGIPPGDLVMFHEMIEKGRKAMIPESVIDAGLAGRQGENIVIPRLITTMVQYGNRLRRMFDANKLPIKGGFIPTLSGRKFTFGSMPALVLDIHGVLLKSTWQEEYAWAYALVLSGEIDIDWDKMSAKERRMKKRDLKEFIKEGRLWINDYFMAHLQGSTSREAPRERLMMEYIAQKYGVAVPLQKVIKGFNKARYIFKVQAETYGKPTEFAVELQKQIQDLQRRYGIEIPVLVLSGTETKYAARQLRKAGLDFFINPAQKKFLVGIDEQKENYVADPVLAPRDQAVRDFADWVPGSLLISVDDWVKVNPVIRHLGGYTFALPQGQGDVFSRNAVHHLSEGSDFIVDPNQQLSLDMFFRILGKSVDIFVERRKDKEVLSPDQAMLDQSEQKSQVTAGNKGGIDFALERWGVKTSGEAQMINGGLEDTSHISGFRPVIESIGSLGRVEDFIAEKSLGP